MNNLKKVWSGLEKFKKKTVFFAFILLITAFFETLGIGVIYQVLRIITDLGFIENNLYHINSAPLNNDSFAKSTRNIVIGINYIM